MATGRYVGRLFDAPPSYPKRIQAYSVSELMEQKKIVLAKLNEPIIQHNALAKPIGAPLRPLITEQDAEHPKSFCEKYMGWHVNPDWEPAAQQNWGAAYCMSLMTAIVFTVVSRNPGYLTPAIQILGNTLTWAMTGLSLYRYKSFNGYEQATQLEALHAVCKELESRGIQSVAEFKFKK